MATRKTVSKNSSLLSILFLVFFVAPCVLHETLMPATLVKPLWLAIYAGITLLFFVLRLNKGVPKLVALYCLLVAICAFLTLGNGTSIGMMLIKIIYVFIGYVGFMLLKDKEMDLWPFDFAMIGIYLFFYKIYYGLLFAGQLSSLDDAFENSSSNAISICLLTVLFIYYLLNIHYKKSRDIVILFFSLVNIVLIFFQGSRGGLIVAVAQSLVCLYTLYRKSESKANKTFVIVIVVSIVVSLVTYGAILMDSYNISGFEHMLHEGSDESRAYLLRAAFERMDGTRFFLGFSSSESIDYDHRTYNAFVDYWLRYGLLPFLLLLLFTIRRFILRKKYSIPVYSFIPLFLYSFAESYLTYGPWQYLLLAALFLGDNSKHKTIMAHKDIK